MPLCSNSDPASTREPLGEIFVTNHKAGSHADAAARDATVVASTALQFGAPIDVVPVRSCGTRAARNATLASLSDALLIACAAAWRTTCSASALAVLSP